MKLDLEMENCYGIPSLSHNFCFSNAGGKRHLSNTYVIYAPNGVMKTSFAKSFKNISLGRNPEEVRFNRCAQFRLKLNDTEVDKEEIYVLESDIAFDVNKESMSKLLVSEDHRKEYDKIARELDKQKNVIIEKLRQKSRLVGREVESTFISDFDLGVNFYETLEHALTMKPVELSDHFIYNNIFKERVLEVFEDNNFQKYCIDFIEKYNEILDGSNGLYKRGVFNPIKAQDAFNTLERQGYFNAGHKLYLVGDCSPVDLRQVRDRQKEVEKEINENKELREIKEELSRVSAVRDFLVFLEKLSNDELSYFLERINNKEIEQLKKDIWLSYLTQLGEPEELIKTYKKKQKTLNNIIEEAKKQKTSWEEAIQLFNTRFANMPFKLKVVNKSDSALGISAPQIEYVFTEGEDSKSYDEGSIENAFLSQGESRAFYLLNFIFEVERRKKEKIHTIFILDDPACSFDYKNKNAILLYLKEIGKIDFFKQIILTHNFDFFRSLHYAMVSRARCLRAVRKGPRVILEQAEVTREIFQAGWKDEAHKSYKILCATIPFTRNIIEYTKNKNCHEYEQLTDILHYRKEGKSFTLKDYWNIYKIVFNIDKDLTLNGDKKVYETIFEEANNIVEEGKELTLVLSSKILLSIAIRLMSEKYMQKKLNLEGEDRKKTFGALLDEYKKMHENKEEEALNYLEQALVAVNNNIHLNAFMYEPILDLGDTHIKSLYRNIKRLNQDEV